MGVDFNLFRIDKQTKKLINIIPTDNCRSVVIERYIRIIKNVFKLSLPIVKYKGEVYFDEIENEEDLNELLDKQDALLSECQTFLTSNDIQNKFNNLTAEWLLENYPKQGIENRSNLDILKHGISIDGFKVLQEEWLELTQAIYNGAVYYYVG